MIKEASPPSTIGKMSMTVNLKSNNWNLKAQVKQKEHFDNYQMEQKHQMKNKY